MFDKPVEFMVRIKLPTELIFTNQSGEYTSDQKACMDAIFAEKPQGFEVRWPKVGQKWPVDSEGFTFVPLYLSSHKDHSYYLLDQNERNYRKIQELKKLAKEISALVGNL
jgi:hypothetical protein